MGKSPTTALTAQANHVLAAVLAYTTFEDLNIKDSVGRFRLKF